MALDINTLYKAHETIEDSDLRRECMHLIMGAIENANDTMGSMDETPEWHSIAIGSLETLVSAVTDPAVCGWFQAQGFVW